MRLRPSKHKGLSTRPPTRIMAWVALGLVAGSILLYVFYIHPMLLRQRISPKQLSAGQSHTDTAYQESTMQPSETFAIEYYVSPTGDDGHPGTQEQPFATLEGARDALRAAGELPPGGARVWIRGGTYSLQHSFRLDARDAGRADAPIVYEAYPGEPVRLVGGADIPADRLTPVTDPVILERLDPAARAEILQVDLKALGITNLGRDWPKQFKGYAHWMELFFDDEPMTLARWPNEGFATVADVVEAGSRPRWNEKPDRPGTFVYEGDRPNRWLSAPEVYLNGYWHFKWYDEALRVANIDTTRKQITFAAPHHYGLGGPSGGFYYAMNLLEEIDSPGEFYLDRETGVLYFWPPEPLDRQHISVSLLDEPMITMRAVSHVTLQGLTCELSRGTGIVVEEGSDNLIIDCTIRNLGSEAIIIKGGANHGVVSCTIYNVGRSGISLSGGNRQTLTPAGHYALNNHIHHYARLERTYQPALSLQGVGCLAAHNLIHDAPHEAIAFGGNEHLIELNEIHDVCMETDDAGAIYAGRDWTMRGNIIRHNFLYRIGGGNHIGVQGVYLDDQFSGTLVFGNVFYANQRAIMIGGGCDNIVKNNLFIDCGQAISLDARGLGWQQDATQEGGILVERLREVPYREEPWRSRYPELVNILQDDPGVPKRNVFRQNVLVNSASLRIDDAAREHGSIGDNWITDQDPGFQDRARLDFGLRPDAAVYEQIAGFVEIPFTDIGLYQDAYHPQLPPARQGP